MILRFRNAIAGTASAKDINEFMKEEKNNIKRDIAWATATISNTFITLNTTRSKTMSRTKRSKSMPTPLTTKEAKPRR